MTIIDALCDSPSSLPTSSRFTILNGIIYMGAGLLLLFWPAGVQVLFSDREFSGSEAELIRIQGMLIAIIGWFYFFGGRSGARQIVAASVIDRIFVVPAVLIPMAMIDVFPHTFLTFAFLDPCFGFIAWYLLQKDQVISSS